MKNYKIAVLPGDGIGKEIMPQAVKALETVSQATEDAQAVSTVH